MNPVYIEGMGVITGRAGRGVEQFENALCEGWIEPEVSADGRKAYRVPKAVLQDRDVLSKARRADRFSRLAVLSAYDAVKDSGCRIEEIQKKTTGLIVATAFGAHSTIFKFLDDIIDYGETKVSPTTFAHSVHNAAASYIASALGCQGPVMTTTQFYFPFQQSLLVAYSWLKEGRVEKVLLGVADECSAAMEYICETKLSLAKDGRMQPLAYSKIPKVVPSEGSVFFLLSLEAGHKKYAAFSGMDFFDNPQGWKDVDLSIIDAHGMAGSEEIYRKMEIHDKPVTAYSDVYGGLMSGSAFDCAVAALMLKKQRLYKNTSQKNEQKVSDESGFTETELNQIQCISHNCNGQLNFIKMIK